MDSQLKAKSILVTVPNLHWIHKHVIHKLLYIIRDNRYRVMIEMPSNKPYENNLHHIVNSFMEKEYQFWLNIDSDNPPMNNPLDLVDLDKDIIGLPTPIWHYEGKEKERQIYWNGYDYDKGKDAYREHKEKKGLQKVDAVGTGCILISRRVFEKPKMRLAPFERKLNKDGTVLKGNDISFCERARENGFEIYCHYDYPCDHFSELSLSECSRSIINLTSNK